MYKINPLSYSSVFALPTQVADKHLRLAGKAQLKVLLWLYRNPASKPEPAVISKDTGIPVDEIDDAMFYWVESGLVLNSSSADSDSEKEIISASESLRIASVNDASLKKSGKPDAEINDKPPQKQKPVLVKPSLKDISVRLTQSEEIRFMFEEAQTLFGRTLGYDAQSSLIILHDHYALPCEVVVMLCNYAKTVGKQGSLAYIMKIGADWAEKGIDTLEKASDKLKRLEKTDKLWQQFRQATGIDTPKPTAKQSEFLEIWHVDYGFSVDMIVYAYEKTAEKKGTISFGYMNGILRSWHEAGYKTVDEAAVAGKSFADGTRGGNKAENKPDIKDFDPSSKNISINADLIKKRSRELDPAKTKKGQ